MIYKREEFVEEDASNKKYPVKQIEVLTPAGGGAAKYFGRLSMGVQTPVGISSIPINFEIDAPTIQEAFAKFESRAEEEIEKAKNELQDQLQEYRRKAQSRIITPGEIAPGGIAPGEISAGGIGGLKV